MSLIMTHGANSLLYESTPTVTITEPNVIAVLAFGGNYGLTSDDTNEFATGYASNIPLDISDTPFQKCPYYYVPHTLTERTGSDVKNREEKYVYTRMRFPINMQFSKSEGYAIEWFGYTDFDGTSWSWNEILSCYLESNSDSNSTHGFTQKANLSYNAYQGTAYPQLGLNNLSSSYSFTKSTWHHFLLGYNTNGLKLYKDGELAATIGNSFNSNFDYLQFSGYSSLTYNMTNRISHIAIRNKWDGTVTIPTKPYVSFS